MGAIRALGVLAGLALVVVFTGPMFAVSDGIASGDLFRDNDWLNCRSLDRLARIAMVEHGVFPLRSHLIGGGFPTIAHPSDGSWSPTMLPVLLAGDVLGTKLNVLLGILLGTWGTWRLGRWLRLAPLGAAFAAVCFGVSGWLPSVLLVGSYHKLVYMAVPGVLALTLEGGTRRRIGAGLLLCFVLQQGGFGFPSVVFMLGVWLGLAALVDAEQGAAGPGGAGSESETARDVLRTVGLLGLLLAPLHGLADASPQWVPAVVCWPAAAVALWRGPRWRQRLRAAMGRLRPAALVLLVACSLGAARIAGIAYLGLEGGNYSHGPQTIPVTLLDNPEGDREEVVRSPSVLVSERSDEFYDLWNLLPGLAGRASPGDLQIPPSARSANRTEMEFGWLGLGWPALLLLPIGAYRLRRRPEVLAVAGVTAGICLGPNLPLDLHQALVGGLPFLSSVGQPVKYFSFFLLLPGALFVGAGIEQALRWMGGDGDSEGPLPILGGKVGFAMGGLVALAVVPPGLQNRAVLGELFARPAMTAEPADGQVLQIDNRRWAEWPLEQIRAESDQLGLREYARPPQATEWVAAAAGVGVIDWYGTLVRPEDAVPARFVLPDGSMLPNPAYRGEAWVTDGDASVTNLDVGPNRITATVDAREASVLVLNQSWLSGFRAGAPLFPATVDGEAAEDAGLIGVRVPVGRHELDVRYRPTLLLLGLALSGISLVGWGVVAARSSE